MDWWIKSSQLVPYVRYGRKTDINWFDWLIDWLIQSIIDLGCFYILPPLRLPIGYRQLHSKKLSMYFYFYFIFGLPWRGSCLKGCASTLSVRSPLSPHKHGGLRPSPSIYLWPIFGRFSKRTPHIWQESIIFLGKTLLSSKLTLFRGILFCRYLPMLADFWYVSPSIQFGVNHRRTHTPIASSRATHHANVFKQSCCHHPHPLRLPSKPSSRTYYYVLSNKHRILHRESKS